MVKHVSLFACLLLLGILLTACGGGDDPTATTVPPTVTTAPVIDEEPTDTNIPESTSAPTVTTAATATAEPTSSPTPQPTYTPRPEPTPTGIPMPTEHTGESDEAPDDDEPGSGVEDDEPAGIGAQLMALLLGEDDLAEPWRLTNTGPAGEYIGVLDFCGAPPFDHQGNLLSGVQVEFGQDPMNGPFLLQEIFAYPPEVTQEAFNSTRDVVSGCSSWTNADGIELFLETADVPAVGDESFGIHLTSQISETETVMADFTFVRMDGLLLAFGWIGLEAVETDRFNEIIQLAISKVEASTFLP